MLLENQYQSEDRKVQMNVEIQYQRDDLI